MNTFGRVAGSEREARRRPVANWKFVITLEEIIEMFPAARKQMKEKIRVSEILRRQMSVYNLSPSLFRNSIQKNKNPQNAASGRTSSLASECVSYVFGRMDPLIRDVRAP